MGNNSQVYHLGAICTDPKKKHSKQRDRLIKEDKYQECLAKRCPYLLDYLNFNNCPDSIPAF